MLGADVASRGRRVAGHNTALKRRADILLRRQFSLAMSLLVSRQSCLSFNALSRAGAMPRIRQRSSFALTKETVSISFKAFDLSYQQR